MFFSLDGIDGAGKSTQVELLCQWLRESGHDVVSCRDPGSTQLGETIRRTVLGDHETPIGPRAEMFLYMAARAQLVDELIAPALKRGKIVVSDRFLLANVVYQGYGGGVDTETIWRIGHTATGGIMPDVTFLLDMPTDAAAARLGHKLDRMENRDEDYRKRLREGFLAEAARNPAEIVVIDGNRPIESIQSDIRREAKQRLDRYAARLK